MASKKSFNFKLNDAVKLKRSGEAGEVVGRAHHTHCDPQYQVEYLTADGRQVCDWIPEASLIAG